MKHDAEYYSNVSLKKRREQKIPLVPDANDPVGYYFFVPGESSVYPSDTFHTAKAILTMDSPLNLSEKGLETLIELHDSLLKAADITSDNEDTKIKSYRDYLDYKKVAETSHTSRLKIKAYYNMLKLILNSSDLLTKFLIKNGYDGVDDSEVSAIDGVDKQLVVFHVDQIEVKEEKELTEATAFGDVDVASTQFVLPVEVAEKIMKYGQAELLDEQVYSEEGFGREDKPHVTVLFGIDKNHLEEVREAIEDYGPVTVTLGKISIFENDGYDVLKIDIGGEDIHNLNTYLKEKIPHLNTWPEYKPHATISYLNAGEGKTFVNDTFFEGMEVTFETLYYSEKGNDDNWEYVPIAMTKMAKLKEAFDSPDNFDEKTFRDTFCGSMKHSAASVKELFEFLDVLRIAAIAEGENVYVVGGLVRDTVNHNLEKIDTDEVIDFRTLDLEGADFSDVDITTEEGRSLEYAWIIKNYYEKIMDKDIEYDWYKRSGTVSYSVGNIVLDFKGPGPDTVLSKDEIEKYVPDNAIDRYDVDIYNRDFTINTIMLRVNDFAVVDSLGKGMEDLKAKILRTALPPELILRTNPLVIMRAIRFKHRLGFKYAEDLEKAMKFVGDKHLKTFDEPRLIKEMRKMICQIGVKNILSDIDAFGLEYLREILLKADQPLEDEELEEIMKANGEEFSEEVLKEGINRKILFEYRNIDDMLFFTWRKTKDRANDIKITLKQSKGNTYSFSALNTDVKTRSGGPYEVYVELDDTGEMANVSCECKSAFYLGQNWLSHKHGYKTPKSPPTKAPTKKKPKQSRFVCKHTWKVLDEYFKD